MTPTLPNQALPRATYRLQLRPGFGFDEVSALAEYLAGVGIDHVYLSPHLQATHGSTHGYDVVDPARVNEELGGAQAHRRMIDALRARGLGIVVDVVPNHMSIGTDENRWWWDILENGRASLYAHYFDVDWRSLEERLENRVLLPILGDHYGRVLEAGDIRFARRGADFVIRVYDRWLPVAPLSLPEVLDAAAVRAGSEELAFLADALSALPAPHETDPTRVERRHRDKAVIGVHLARLLDENAEVAAALDSVADEINADVERLDGLLERQNYRLARWQVARHDLAYRRFFDINELGALRAEDPRVFETTHALILRWVAEGVVAGLRIDHPDGLRDPAAYFARLRAHAPNAWIVAEKILEPGEHAPETWAIDGTTGYDAMRFLTGVHIDAAGLAGLRAAHEAVSGVPLPDYASLVRERKRAALDDLLYADLDRVTSLFERVCVRHRRFRDFSRTDLRAVLRELIACFPVYRTYLRDAGTASAVDAEYIAEAARAALAETPSLDPDLVGILCRMLRGELAGTVERELALRFQQLSGPAMAKGVEDGAFYRYVPCLAVCEVGHDPSDASVSLDRFHAELVRRASIRSRSMLSLSTHDTKRSADVRARLALLSECAQLWGETLDALVRASERHRGERVDGATLSYFFQSWVGAHPISVERMIEHIRKAARESKERTSWARPDAEYEAELESFVRATMEDSDVAGEVERFVRWLEPAWITSALSQQLVLLTAPGVPDVYQGSELWDLSLTDPDNRREVDFALRAEMLPDAREADPKALMARARQGLPKLAVTARALGVRASRPECFAPHASYAPLRARGEGARHVVAYRRGDSVIAVSQRLCLAAHERKLGDTLIDLPEGRWRDVLAQHEGSGGTVRVADLLSAFPVALIVRVDA